MLKRILATIGVLFSMASATQAADLENTLYMDVKDGRVVIEMRPDLAPNHVARIKELVRRGFYDGVLFHRVIDGFMAQTGDPTGTGMGGSGQKINAEFSDAPHLRGAVSMARPGDINGADSQFFIMLADYRSLDGQYTVWGQVTQGMEFIDNIKKGSPNPALNGKVEDPDKIILLRVAADVEKAAAQPVAPVEEAPSAENEPEAKNSTTTEPVGEGAAEKDAAGDESSDESTAEDAGEPEEGAESATEEATDKEEGEASTTEMPRTEEEISEKAQDLAKEVRHLEGEPESNAIMLKADPAVDETPAAETAAESDAAVSKDAAEDTKNADAEKAGSE